MKIGIILYQNMRYAPFLKVYENLLKDMENITYDILYVNRNPELNEVQDGHHISIPWKKLNCNSKLEKIYNTLAYPGRIRKKILNGKYDFLIILTTMPAVLLSGLLLKRYRGKYLIDIRDYTQEEFTPYFKIEKQVFSGAAMRVISSPDFVEFLPEGQYRLCHNLNANEEEINYNPYHFKKAEGRPIVISYIGSICYGKQCKQLIELVRKDPRFVMRFYGNESVGTEVSDYVKQVDDTRIQLMGPFTPDEKPHIFQKSDLVFNCYGNDAMLVQYAISNKHYDGALYRRPLLVSPKTTMAKLAGENAYVLDLDAMTNLDGLYEWYQGLDQEKYTLYANTVLKDAFQTNEETYTEIIRCICSMKEK